MLSIYFSEFFGLTPDELDKAGALDVSLVTDLPLFIDPFLLFNSEKPEYQALHREILDYMIFLRNLTQAGPLSKGVISALFSFKEVKHTWLGFSRSGNAGHGLGVKFANALHHNFNGPFRLFGSESITRASHLEKLCLIRSGVGRDTISDFTTNLIKRYLAEFTQAFASEHLPASARRRIAVPKVKFDYGTNSWSSAVFELPFVLGDYVLLTPKDILTKDQAWINRSELIGRFLDIADSVTNEELRAQLNAYLARALANEHKMTKGEKEQAIVHGIEQYPDVLDYYILNKEEHADEASSVARERVQNAQSLLINNVRDVVRNILLPGGFYRIPRTTYDEAKRRVMFLKDAIENKGCHRIFYHKGEPITRESDVQILFQLTWFATESDVGREVNDGRGPVDFKVSRGAKDKTLVEFKLASNPKLERNLQRQLQIYEKASDPTHPSIKAIVYFSNDELERVGRILTNLGLHGTDHIVLIDARRDNKPSGSRA
jgi:hypothetical protein